MTILTTTFNCSQYIEQCLNSLRSQNFKDFVCYITDDLSTDNTKEIIKRIISNDNRFILIENQTKKYQPGNYDYIIRELNLDDDEVCVEVDGDDWLPNPFVLGLVNEYYKDKNLWMTTGSFRYSTGNPGFSKPPTSYENIRKDSFVLSHMRTWRSWLWKKINPDDLKDENGEYWRVAGDLAFMFPMFEMSGKEHYKFIPAHTYVYNETNPLNDHKVDFTATVSIAKKIRNKQPYKKL